jgi:hypothetical protein
LSTTRCVELRICILKHRNLHLGIQGLEIGSGIRKFAGVIHTVESLRTDSFGSDIFILESNWICFSFGWDLQHRDGELHAGNYGHPSPLSHTAIQQSSDR